MWAEYLHSSLFSTPKILKCIKLTVIAKFNPTTLSASPAATLVEQDAQPCRPALLCSALLCCALLHPEWSPTEHAVDFKVMSNTTASSDGPGRAGADMLIPLPLKPDVLGAPMFHVTCPVLMMHLCSRTVQSRLEYIITRAESHDENGTTKTTSQLLTFFKRQ